jgi:hypothetical protein
MAKYKPRTSRKEQAMSNLQVFNNEGNLQVFNTELKNALEAHESCTVTNGGNALSTLHGDLSCDACDVIIIEFYEDGFAEEIAAMMERDRAERRKR